MAKLSSTTHKIQLQNPPASYKSKVWKYFGFERKESVHKIDRTKPARKICSVTVGCKSGTTTNMATHFK